MEQTTQILSYPPTIFIMAGLVLAASLTGIFSFINLIISKEQKISEFRQAWIDALRQELSTLLGNIETLTRLAEFKLSSQKKDKFDEKELADFRNENKELYVPLNEMRHRIDMRVNPRKDRDLVEYIDTLMLTFRGSCNKERINNTYKSIEKVKIESQEILKTEWVRVKKGENTYRWTKYIFIIIFIVVIAVLIMWVER